MVKDRFGQDIGPGDVVFDILSRKFCVVTSLNNGDWMGEEVEVYWVDAMGLRGGADVAPKDLIRISDYSDFDPGTQKWVQNLENLYKTITGERYG